MLALWLIVLISILGARVVASTRSSTGLASNIRAQVGGRYAAESGVVLGAALVHDSLVAITDAAARSDYLNSLAERPAHQVEAVIGKQRFSIVYVDVNTRLDINNASQSQLARLFSYFTGPVEAASAARAVISWIGAGDILSGYRYGSQRSDIVFPTGTSGRPLRTLEDLRRIPGVPERVAFGAAPYLTVDGDGKINRSAASDTVLSAAAGSLVDEPSRILIVSRGWLDGNPLTHEIQAVYAIEGSNLVLIRWQERDL